MKTFSASFFPASNLSPHAQQWRAEVERRVGRLENQDASGQTRRALAQWSPAIGAINNMEDRIQDLTTLSAAANAKADDAVTWHDVAPVSPGEGVENPDIPINQNATWYVCELSEAGGVDKDRVKEVWQWNAPGTPGGGDTGRWIQQKWGTDALGEGAVDYKNLAAAAKGDLEAAKALTGRFDALAASYEETKADLAQAKADLANVVAGAKDVIISDTEPTGADRKPGNLWVSTAGGKTALYVFDGDQNAWVAVEGEEAAQAAAAAAEAQHKALEALTKAQAVEDLATAAKLAAERAQKSADGKNTIFYQSIKPTLNGRVEGDLWYDTDDNYKMYRYSAFADDFIEAGVAASDLTGPVTGATATGIWNQALDSGAPQAKPINGQMIAPGSITTPHVQALDAGVITSGFIGADRIAARSITAAQIAAGTITSQSGVIGSLDAGDIKTGTISADRISVSTLKGKKIEGGTISGGIVSGASVRGVDIIGSNIRGNTISGGVIDGTSVRGVDVIGSTIRGNTITGGLIMGSSIATTENGQGDRVVINSSNGVAVWRGNRLYAQMHPSIPNALKLNNPRTSALTEVSSIIFGATFQQVGGFRTPENNGILYYSWVVPAPASGRAAIIATIHYETGAQAPNQHQRMMAKNKNSDAIFDTGLMRNDMGWSSDACVFNGVADGMPTSGNMVIWTMVGMWSNNQPFIRYSSNFASILVIPC